MKKLIYFFILLIIITPKNIYAEMPFDNYIVRDINSNRIFEEKASNIKKLPASTTKIMTAIVAIENSNLTDVVEVGDEIKNIDGSNIYIEQKEHILMQDLLYGLLLRSGNDAAMTIAKHTGGTVENFVKMMNDKARSLGLVNTIYNNPSGLDDKEKNYSTAKDLSTIYNYAYQNKDFKQIIKTKTYQTSTDKKSYYFKNRSKILSMYNKCTGAKTGYTEKAGRLLISSSKDKDLEVSIVSIGNTYGYENHIDKYEEIFKKYQNYKILRKGKIKETKKAKYYIEKNFYYPLTKEEKNKIKKKIYIKEKEAIIYIYLNKNIIHKEKLIIKEKKQNPLNKILEIFK